MERRFYLVDAQVLPEVFLKVVRAKELLASGEARSISAATRAVDLSRSAFYKYKDCIFDSENGREVITVMATLRDETGALQSLLAGISAAGASIVTINQSTIFQSPEMEFMNSLLTFLPFHGIILIRTL